MAKRPNEHEELQRDEVAETLHVWIEWYQHNRKQVIYTAVGLLVALMLWLLLQSQRERKRQELTSNFNKAMTEFLRLDTLTDPRGREENEKIALQTLGTLIDDHGDKPLGNEARLMRGKLYFGKDQFAQAQKDFQDYIDRTKDDESRARGEIALAYAFENEAFMTTGTQQQRTKLETARQHYQNAEKLMPKGSYLTSYARLGEARYFELINQPQEAIKIYDEVMKSRPAPMPPATAEEKAESKDASQIAALRKQLDESMKAFSYEIGAKLRVDRLKAQLAATSGTATTVVTTP